MACGRFPHFEHFVGQVYSTYLRICVSLFALLCLLCAVFALTLIYWNDSSVPGDDPSNITLTDEDATLLQEFVSTAHENVSPLKSIGSL